MSLLNDCLTRRGRMKKLKINWEKEVGGGGGAMIQTHSGIKYIGSLTLLLRRGALFLVE